MDSPRLLLIGSHGLSSIKPSIMTSGKSIRDIVPYKLSSLLVPLHLFPQVIRAITLVLRRQTDRQCSITVGRPEQPFLYS